MIERIIHHLPLPLLERVGQHWQFRCVVCGDSAKDPNKKRGWILVDGTKVTYYCHNCGYSKPIVAFLKDQFPDVHKIYIKERLKGKKKDSSKIVQTKIEKPEPGELPSRFDLPTLNRLDPGHEAVQYFNSRKLPPKYLRYLYWTDNFKQFTNSVLPGKFEDENGEGRIVIPFYNRHRKIFIFQGRSLEAESRLRYITIKLDDGYHKKVWGLEQINFNKTILVFEGAFDAMFMPNAIAMGGADLDLNFLSELAPKEKYIYCFDNEPRNREMCARVEKVLKAGFRVCLMPYKYKSRGKDINDLILSGMTVREVCGIIKENKIEGKFGMMKYKLWKKGSK